MEVEKLKNVSKGRPCLLQLGVPLIPPFSLTEERRHVS